MFASNDWLQCGLADWSHDMHSLAYTIIVLAGGVLPWSTGRTQQEILQRQQQYKDVSPEDFVNEYSQHLDAVLLEWVKRALSLQEGNTIVYHIFLDYLWEE